MRSKAGAITRGLIGYLFLVEILSRHEFGEASRELIITVIAVTLVFFAVLFGVPDPAGSTRGGCTSSSCSACSCS